MKMRILRAVLLLSVAVSLPRAALGQGTSEARAGPPSDAQNEGRQHFSRGLALYHEGDFNAARVEFQRAYDSAPSYRILYNLGQSAYELLDYAGAVAAFSRYLAEGADRIPIQRRVEVEKTLRELEQRVGRLEIVTNVAGADVTVDGVHVGTTPLATPVVASVGRRNITATHTGRIPVIRNVDVAGGDRVYVALELVAPEVTPFPTPVAMRPPAPTPPPPAPPPLPSPAPPRISSNAPAWVAAGTTGALAVTSTVFGVLTIRANDSLNADLGRFPGSASAIADDRSRVHMFALLADTLGGAAVLGAVITGYFLLSRHDEHPPASVAAGASSARLEWRF
jgi:hypothetical protein